MTLFSVAGLGLFMGFLRAHAKAASSTPGGGGNALQSDFSSITTESWFFY